MPLHRFTSENAARFGRMGADARRRKQEQIVAAAQAEEQRQSDLARDLLPADDYLRERLLYVRRQLKRLDEMLLVENDAQKLSWLATTTAKLAEQERVICGRPMPGQYRPTSPRRRSDPMPIPTPE